MALRATLMASFGEVRELYIRLNNFEQLANHGAPAIALFRGYISKEAFETGASYVWEKLVTFPADAPDKPWEQAYAALRTLDRTQEHVAELERVAELVTAAQAQVTVAEEVLPALESAVEEAKASPDEDNRLTGAEARAENGRQEAARWRAELDLRERQYQQVTEALRQAEAERDIWAAAKKA